MWYERAREVDVGQSISIGRSQELGLRGSQIPVGPSGESEWTHSAGFAGKEWKAVGTSVESVDRG